MQSDIVLCYGDLRVDIHNLFAQIEDELKRVNEWYLEIEARRELSVIFLEAMDKTGIVLADHYDEAKVKHSTS